MPKAVFVKPFKRNLMIALYDNGYLSFCIYQIKSFHSFAPWICCKVVCLYGGITGYCTILIGGFLENMEQNFLYYLIVALILGSIPVAGKYVSVINTLLHEVGHALMASILGGKVRSISLFANTEGTAVTAHSSQIARNFTALAGYPFSSVCGFVMVWSIKHGYSSYILIAWCSLLIIAFFLWIRNLYGFFWALSFGAITYYVMFQNVMLKEPFAYFITAVVVVQSLASALIILYLSLTRPESSGDASNLAHSTRFIPPFIWGFLFAGQAVYFFIQELHILYS